MRSSRRLTAFTWGLIALTVILGSSGFTGGPSAARKNAPRAKGPIITVQDAASFNAAMARARPGTTIQLADGSYPALKLDKRRFASPVTIAGSRNVKLAGIDFRRSKNLVLKGVTVTPPGTEAAKIWVEHSSSKIVLDGVFVDGRDEDVGAYLRTERGTSDVTIRNSQLTNCGRGGGCIRPGAKNLRVIRNRFYDCRSCTFIKSGGNGAYVRGNTFDLAHNVRCTGGQAGCPHNDLIHITGGGPWTIVGNRFGDYHEGAAQVYANPGLSNDDNPIHDLLIASNIFSGDGGVSIRIGIGTKSGTPPPKNVRIVNNTILSGRLTALLLVLPWDQVPVDQRPLVANNILSRVIESSCGRGRFVSNLVLSGAACAQDRTGDANLDANTAAPTAQSSLVVNKADPRYAPKTDFYGRQRRGLPDLGAIELGGR